MSRSTFPNPILIGPPAPLQASDLSVLMQGNRTTTSVQRMRASHHRVARMAAFGTTQKEIAALTGYSRERVSQLLGSPAMKELVAVYMERVAEKDEATVDAYLDIKLANMMAAERHIADHFAELDDANELMPVNTALRVAADGADRLGYGKHQTIKQEHTFAVQLEAAIRRSGKVIDSVPMKTIPRIVAPSPVSSPNSRSDSPVQPLILRRA